MEKNLTKSLEEILKIHIDSPTQLSPLVLAYIGDSIYDLVIKTYLLETKGNMPVNKLNHYASHLLKAVTQSAMMEQIEPTLSKEEEAVYKRGRNAKSYTCAKNASVAEYRKATGFEALLGWLYLKGEFDRMMEIIKMGVDSLTLSRKSPAF